MWKPVFPANATRFRLTGGRMLSGLAAQHMQGVVPGEAFRPREGDPEREAGLDLLGSLPLAALGRERHGESFPETFPADLLIEQGRIAEITAPGGLDAVAAPEIKNDDGLVLPCFVDVHTHLDKGYIWSRCNNPDGTFAAAVRNVAADREANWSAEDVRRRIDFGLRTAYAHGTAAIRTHLDSAGEQTAISWPVFEELREKWAGRIALQAVSIFAVDRALDDAEFAGIVAAVSRARGVLGAVTYMVPGLEEGLERILRAASEHGLDLDFHVDETADPAARSLAMIAQTAIRHDFKGKILAGHCCSLAQQPLDEADRTIDLVAAAGIGVVSLPMCNMHLQDRSAGRTPRWRGVTLLHELKARGVPVMAASDNVRDPFYAYGDLDMLEVFREAVRIAHLDTPFADWPEMVTGTPAAQMRLPGFGAIQRGGPADLVLCRARSLNELLSRPQADRVVLRDGKPISRELPDYRELDDLMRVP